MTRYACMYMCTSCEVLGLAVRQGVGQVIIVVEDCWNCGSALNLTTLHAAEIPDRNPKLLEAVTA